MNKLFFTAFTGILLLSLPILSHAAFDNFTGVESGRATRMSAKFITLDMGVHKSKVLFSGPSASTAVITVTADKKDRQLYTDTVLDDGRIIIPATNSGMLSNGPSYLGNINLTLEFYTGDLGFDQALDQYTGTGRRYSLDASAEGYIISKNTVSHYLVIKIIGATTAFYDEFVAGTILGAPQPAAATAVKIPFMVIK